jgi:YVTN family beta-propeller protein
MRARESHHVVAGHHGGTSARWRRAGAVAAVAALPLAVCVTTAIPASAAGGYTVTATIAVGGGPDGVAVDPAARTAYVTNINDDTVSVIDESTGTVTATIDVGSGPDAVAVDPATHTAYVTNGGNATVSVIDESTGTVTATIDVGSDPSGVAVDPTAHTAYVTNLAGTVSVIDETAGTVAATVPVGSDPDGVAVDPTSHTAYVTNENANSVAVISAARPAPVTTVTSSRNPSTFGQRVTFTATVGPADGGTVTFSHGSKALCRAVSLTQVSGLTYQATCATRALPGGRGTITAGYSGHAGYAPSTGLLTQTVTRVPTALTASIGLSRHLAVTLTATLTASGRPLSAKPVSFSTGHTHLCTPHTSTAGVATCVLADRQTRLAVRDNDPIGASYPGSTSYRPSSATAALPLFP